MSLELEQAIQAAKRNDLQEAMLKLCEAMRQLENKMSYLELETSEIEELKDLYKNLQKKKASPHKKVKKGGKLDG